MWICILVLIMFLFFCLMQVNFLDPILMVLVQNRNLFNNSILNSFNFLESLWYSRFHYVQQYMKTIKNTFIFIILTNLLLGVKSDPVMKIALLWCFYVDRRFSKRENPPKIRQYRFYSREFFSVKRILFCRDLFCVPV